MKTRTQTLCNCYHKGATIQVDDTIANIVKRIAEKHGTVIKDNGYNSMDHEQPRLVIADGDYEVGLWVYGGPEDGNEGEILSITIFQPGYYEGERELNLNELSPSVLAMLRELGEMFGVAEVESYDGSGQMLKL